MRNPVRTGTSHQTTGEATRQQVLQAQSEIEELLARIEGLEHSKRRLKCQLSKEKELVKDVRVETDHSRAELVRAEEKIDEMEAAMVTLRRDFNQYRGWWLTENRSLEVVLREVPKRKWDKGLRAIASSSRGRFMSYCGDGSN
jgi:chromosome segregation ATPase